MSAAATRASLRRADLLAVTLLAAAVRLPTLSRQSLWLDEAYTDRLVHLPLSGMWSAIPKSESTPPLFYLLTWVWTRLTGYSEVSLRSLPALAGILTVPVLAAVAARLAGRRAGVSTGILVALAPLMVWFSQEARAYSLATLFSAVALLCFVSLLDGGGGRWLAGWALASGLGLLSHYFVGFVVAPELVWLLGSRRRARPVMAAAGAVTLLVVALMPLALAQRHAGHADYIAQRSLLVRVLQIPKQALVGYSSPGQIVTSILAAAVLIGAILPLARRGERARTGAAKPLAIGAAALLLPVVLAIGGLDYLNTRNLLPALAPLYVVLGIGLAAALPGRRRSLVPTVALAVLCGAIVLLVETHPRYQRDDWREASHALGAPAATRALVVSPGTGLVPLQAYQPGLALMSAPAAVSELDVVVLPGHLTGGGLRRPPRPLRALPVPPGFRLFAARYAGTYTVLRFRAPRAEPVSVSTATEARLGPGDFTVLLQRPGR